eukprot:GHVU01232426.1.p2 GENE.GHVU01232426.1~~GHVU01232426.1.p2  ORF type:complete len:123 (-),score=1.68 GHVU01232426.1:826-1194(-)
MSHVTCAYSLFIFFLFFPFFLFFLSPSMRNCSVLRTRMATVIGPTPPGIGVMLLSYSAAGASDSFFLVSPFFPAPFFAGLSSFPFFSSASGLSAPFLAGFGAILLTAGKKLSHYMYLAAKCS